MPFCKSRVIKPSCAGDGTLCASVPRVYIEHPTGDARKDAKHEKATRMDVVNGAVREPRGVRREARRERNTGYGATR